MSGLYKMYFRIYLCQYNLKIKKTRCHLELCKHLKSYGRYQINKYLFKRY